MKGETPISDLSYEELEHARDLGAITYLSAYINLMTRHLEVDGTQEEMNAMAIDMVDIINLATRIAWCALMDDKDGVNSRLEELKSTAETLLEKSHVE